MAARPNCLISRLNQIRDRLKHHQAASWLVVSQGVGTRISPGSDYALAHDHAAASPEPPRTPPQMRLRAPSLTSLDNSSGPPLLLGSECRDGRLPGACRPRPAPADQTAWNIRRVGGRRMFHGNRLTGIRERYYRHSGHISWLPGGKASARSAGGTADGARCAVTPGHDVAGGLVPWGGVVGRGITSRLAPTRVLPTQAARPVPTRYAAMSGPKRVVTAAPG